MHGDLSVKHLSRVRQVMHADKQHEQALKVFACGGQVGLDGTRSGWLADDGRRLQALSGAVAIDWRTADCAPGDVIVLGAYGYCFDDVIACV